MRAAIEDIIQDNSRAVDTVHNVKAIFQRDAVDMALVDLEGILHDVNRIVGQTLHFRELLSTSMCRLRFRL